MTDQTTFTREEVRAIIADAVRYGEEDFRRERLARGESWEPWMADSNAVGFLRAHFGVPT